MVRQVFLLGLSFTKGRNDTAALAQEVLNAATAASTCLVSITLRTDRYILMFYFFLIIYFILIKHIDL